MDPLTLGIVAGGTGLLQAGAGAYGAYQQRQAAKEQLKAAKQAQGAITDTYGQAQGYQQPYLGAGQVGLNQMMQGNYDVNVPQYQAGEVPGPYQAPTFNYRADPGMAYRMQTGLDAVQSGAAAQGTGLSGATQKAIAKFGQNLASQEYGYAYNRFAADRNAGLQGYQTNLGRAQDIRNTGWGAAKDIYGMGAEQAQNRYGRASDLGRIGQTAAGNLSDLASNYGANLAGLYGTQGQIGAQSRMGQAQNVSNTIGGIGNTAMDYMTLSSLLGKK